MSKSKVVEKTLSKTMQKSRKKRIFRENVELSALVFPGFICMLIFKYLPMAGIVIAFKNYVPRKGMFGSDWVGFENFKFLFSSPDLGRLIRNTVLYGSSFLIFDMITAIALALFFFYLKNKVALNIYKSIYQLPRFLSVIIVSYIVYALLSPSYGIVNQIITHFGGEAIKWYSDPVYWPFILIFVHIWMMVGGGSLLYYANLLSLDPALFEAADMDGATVLQKCRYICLPSFKPIIAMNLTLGIGGVISVDMGLFDAVPRAQGLLFPSTDIIGTYVYRGVLNGDFSMPAAVGLFQSVVAITLILVSNQIIRKISPENSMF